MSLIPVNFQSIVDHLSVPLMICNSKSEVYYLNPEALKLFGFPEKPVTMPSIEELLIFEESHKKNFEKMLKEKKNGCVDAFKYLSSAPDQMTLFEINLSFLKDVQVVPALYLVELKSKKKFELNEDQMKTLGTRTGEIAHAISNPLAIIRIGCDTIDIKIQKGTEIDNQTLAGKIDKLSNAANRITNEINRLKDLSSSLRTLNHEKLFDLLSDIDETSDDGRDGFH